MSWRRNWLFCRFFLGGRQLYYHLRGIPGWLLRKKQTPDASLQSLQRRSRGRERSSQGGNRLEAGI